MKLRSIAALALLAFTALVGGWAALTTYGLASTYADPTGSSLGSVGAFGLPVLLGLAVTAALAFGAVAAAPPPWRSGARLAAVAIVVVTTAGLVAGSQLGFRAKQAETSTPPRCGVGNAALNRQFRSIDHPGFFGGGWSSRTGCSYMLTARSTGTAIDEYEARLRAASWEVAPTGHGLTATRGSYRLTVEEHAAVHGPPYLEVTLRG